ncbi:MAG: amidohydrolase family protein [Planctomycetaceae bacterium]|nr:amidohydrolase family protein [Planctomycetaceae bacterium]
MNFIDAHSHIWTQDTKSYPLAAGWRRLNIEPKSWTAEELLKEAATVGVDRVVLIQMSFYGFDNSYMLDSIRKFPGKFSGVAVIDQDSRRPDMEMRMLKGQGVRGFRIYSKNQMPDKWLSSDAMHAMWTCGAEERLAMCCLMDPDELPALDRMCRDFPETPVVIDHLCRIGVSGTVEPKDVKALCDMARHKNVTVKVSAFYALGKKKSPYTDLGPMIKQVVDAFGPERLMWATDCPFQVAEGHNYKDSIELIKNKLDFLSAADKEWLLRKTAERVFFGK